MSLLILSLVSPNTITETNNYNSPTLYKCHYTARGCMSTYYIQEGALYHSSFRFEIGDLEIKDESMERFLIILAIP